MPAGEWREGDGNLSVQYTPTRKGFCLYLEGDGWSFSFCWRRRRKPRK